MSPTIAPAHQNLAPYLAIFAARQTALPGGTRLRGLREAAIERFASLGFPTTRNEDWKYTNLAPSLRLQYAPAEPVPEALAARELARAPFAGPASPRLVFVNGLYSPALSNTTGVSGLKVGRLRDALESGAADGHLAQYAGYEQNALVALNTAMHEDGAFIQIPDRTVVEQPIYLLFLTAAAAGPAMTFPRNLIIAGRECQVSIVEAYLGVGEEPYFTSSVTEVAAGDGAVVEHHKIQFESRQALHFGMLAARQGRSSNFASHNLALGAGLARNEILAVLDGEGAEATLNGLYVTTAEQHVDNYTTLDHAQPYCSSHELYKGVLDGKSEGVFHGRIIVRPEAQKTDAIQRNKNLLLSKTAIINTKPQLEIYADDVKCTHGATVGQIDQEAMFYLRTRGIPREEARSLLTRAFAGEIVDRIKVEAVRAGLREALQGLRP